MLPRLIVCVLLWLCALGAGHAAPPAWFSEHSQEIKAKAREHNVPGYVFVFVERGRPPRVETFGFTRKRGERISENTVFRLASVSKTFTGVLMAKLVEQRQLDWQTSVSSLAPEFGFTQAGMDRLNLRHVVGQSSGYMPNAYDNLIEANYPLKRVLNKLADLEPLCDPGNCYTYQNALFGVLSHYFAEQDSSYHDKLKQELFTPLSMPHASAGKASLLSSAQWARPHIAIAKDKWREGKVQESYYRFSPAAGVNASIRDMTIWLRTMLGEYPQVVSSEVVTQVTTPTVKTKREMRRRGWRGHLNDAHYGLGWRVYDFDGYKLNYHGGWVKGYRADVAFAPEQGVGYAMLMNAESNLINQFTADFWSRYFADFAEQQRELLNATSTQSTTTPQTPPIGE